MREIPSWSGWFEHWMHRAEQYAERGNLERSRGHDVSAGEFLWLSSLTAHYAQFLWFHDVEQREAGQRYKQERYRDAAPLLRPVAERVDIAFEDTVLPGYLRLPGDMREPVPVAVLIGGLESTKEESYCFEQMCLRRGLATFAFDGPGQGEYFFDRPLVPEFHRTTSVVLDHLASRAEIDASRVGVVGRSLGGFYALQSAARDARIRACVSWGGLFDLDLFDAMDPLAQAGFAYVAGYDDPVSAAPFLRETIDLSTYASDITCPVYMLHGEEDKVIGPDQLAKFRKTLNGPNVHWDVRPEGNHCCHNLSHLIRPSMIDWIVDQMRDISIS